MNTVVSLPEWVHKQDMKSTSHDWLNDFRQAHWQNFLAHGLPTRKTESWKYADLTFLGAQTFATPTRVTEERLQDAIHQHRLQHGDSILLVFVNGYFMPLLSDTAKLPQGIIACDTAHALQHHAELIKTAWPDHVDAKHYPFAAWNAAISEQGLFFYLPDQCELVEPLHVLSMAIDNEACITHPRHLFLLGKNSKLTLVEEHFTPAAAKYMVNAVAHFYVAKDAQLHYCKIQNESSEAVHLAHTFIYQMQDSQVTLTNFSNGARFARDEVVVTLQEAGAHCSTGGFYQLCDDNQYIDNHIDIHHAAERSHSEMLYKGTLDNKSRAVFNGRLHVEKDAQRILAYQANHNLLLSNHAEMYSKPELEIYADDVKCKHGASIGQIDKDALFYLRARGIEESAAMDLLLQGFRQDVLQRVTHKGIKLRIEETLSCK